MNGSIVDRPEYEEKWTDDLLAYFILSDWRFQILER